jgi:hypothetical protein
MSWPFAKDLRGSIEHREAIANFETGNPPEGWESEGQLRISNFEKVY